LLHLILLPGAKLPGANGSTGLYHHCTASTGLCMKALNADALEAGLAVRAFLAFLAFRAFLALDTVLAIALHLSHLLLHHHRLHKRCVAVGFGMSLWQTTVTPGDSPLA
jgi:hypothetical protein